MSNNEKLNTKIELSEAVVDKLVESANSFPEKISGVKISIIGRKDGLFDHKLTLIDEGQEDESDLVQLINDSLNC